jgi:hypothetical protein
MTCVQRLIFAGSCLLLTNYCCAHWAGADPFILLTPLFGVVLLFYLTVLAIFERIIFRKTGPFDSCVRTYLINLFSGVAAIVVYALLLAFPLVKLANYLYRYYYLSSVMISVMVFFSLGAPFLVVKLACINYYVENAGAKRNIILFNIISIIITGVLLIFWAR